LKSWRQDPFVEFILGEDLPSGISDKEIFESLAQGASFGVVEKRLERCTPPTFTDDETMRLRPS